MGVVGLFEVAVGLLAVGDAGDRVEALHLTHGGVGGHGGAGVLEASFEAPQVGHGGDAGEEVAANLAVGSVADGLHADQWGRFAGSEGVLDLPAVEVRLDDLGRAAITVVGDDDALAEHAEAAACALGVLLEAHAQPPGCCSK